MPLDVILNQPPPALEAFQPAATPLQLALPPAQPAAAVQPHVPAALRPHTGLLSEEEFYREKMRLQSMERKYVPLPSFPKQFHFCSLRMSHLLVGQFCFLGFL